MALLFMDGFDAGDALTKWNLGGSGASNTTTPFGIGRSWFLNSFSQTIKKSFTPSTQIFAGFHYRTSNTVMQGTAFFRIYGDSGATNHLSLMFTGPTTIAVYRGATQLATGTATEPLDSWAYIEISATIHDSTGSCSVRVNSAPVINFTGDTKNAGSSTNIDAVAFTAASSSAVQFDNFYVCDATGSSPYNTFLGEVRIETVTPNGAGTDTQFTPSTGANYTTVDELPYSSVDYIYATASGTRDTYTMSNVPSGYNVLAVQSNVIAKKTDAGGTAVRPAIISGGSLYYGSSVALTPTDTTISDIRTIDPATSTTWTISGVNNIEAGVEVV